MPHRPVKRAGQYLAAALVLACAGPAQADGTPGEFDFYVLALTWSPSFCETEPSARGSSQCRAGAGHGFVAHGLWPQYERDYPEFCADGAVERLPAELVASMLDIMPDRHLVEHEWEKHGTCSGLTPEAYFESTRAAFDRIAIPPVFVEPRGAQTGSARDVEDVFAAANPGLTADGMAVACSDTWMAEVRICLTRELAFRGCAQVDRHGCRQRRIAIPAPH